VQQIPLASHLAILPPSERTPPQRAHHPDDLRGYAALSGDARVLLSLSTGLIRPRRL